MLKEHYLKVHNHLVLTEHYLLVDHRRMDLKTYLRTLPDEAARLAFAERCGTTLKYLRMVAYKAKTIGESLALNVERESSGAVRVESLRPDVAWHVISDRPADPASQSEAA